jgi:peptide/nickel transport system permease protein
MSYLTGKFRQFGVVRIGFGFIAGIAVFAMFLATVLIPGYDARSARRIDYEAETFQSPAQHPPLGTDSLGRDVFKLLVAGSRSFFIPGLIAAGVALFLGASYGATSGYYEGRWVSFITPVATAFESMPRWVLIVVVCAISKANIYWVMLILGLTNFPKVATLVKGRVLQLKEEQFVEAAKELGLRDSTIIWRHLLRKNCKHILFGQAMHGMADAILVETTIRYLFYNVGADVSWGRMVVDGVDFFFAKAPFTDVHPYWLWLSPTVMIILTIAGFYILGDALTRWYEAKGEESSIRI